MFRNCDGVQYQVFDVEKETESRQALPLWPARAVAPN